MRMYGWAVADLEAVMVAEVEAEAVAGVDGTVVVVVAGAGGAAETAGGEGEAVA